MDVYTWISPVKTKAELIALISLVEDGTLEELFIAQSRDAGVAGKEWKVGQVLVFSFASSLEAEERLREISECFNLDEIEEDYFEQADGVYILKDVFYPESEAQEEQIIALLA